MADAKLGVKYPPREFRGVKVLTSSTTLTKEDSHKLIVFDHTTGITATLPPTKSDFKFTFFVKTAATSGTHQISPNANDMLLFKSGSAFADDKDAVHTSATEVIGDGITFVGDGNLGYYGIAVAGAWSREA